MTAVVCIHQPDFAPWLGFFHRLLRCDVFVVLDNVQFLRQGWHHRDKIRLGDREHWLTVPVLKTGRYTQTIAETEIDDGADWRRKHLGTLASAYGKAPHFDTVMPWLEALYRRNDRSLMAFNMAVLAGMQEMLGLTVPTFLASRLPVSGTGSARLVSIVRAVGGDGYLTGTGARDYLDEAAFAAAGIGVRWQRFSHPAHRQCGEGFLPGLSTLDALFNVGPAETRRLLEAAGA